MCVLFVLNPFICQWTLGLVPSFGSCDLICGLAHGLFWGLSRVHLRRMCIPLLGRVFCVWLLDLAGLHCSSPLVPYFCLVVLSSIENGLLKSPAIIVELYFSSISSAFASCIFPALTMYNWQLQLHMFEVYTSWFARHIHCEMITTIKWINTDPLPYIVTI